MIVYRKIFSSAFLCIVSFIEDLTEDYFQFVNPQRYQCNLTILGSPFLFNIILYVFPTNFNRIHRLTI